MYTALYQSLRFILRELRTDAGVGGVCDNSCNDRYNRTRMLLLRVYRKCATSMIRLFMDQLLRARALAVASPSHDDVRQRRRSKVVAVVNNRVGDYGVGGCGSGSDGSTIVLRCHVCKRVFDKTFQYLQHIRVHYRLNMYLCRACGKTFVQQNGLDYQARRCCPFNEVLQQQQQRKSIAQPKLIFYRNYDREQQTRCTEVAAAMTMVRKRRRTGGGEKTEIRSLELCESCDRLQPHGPTLRNHVLLRHVKMNIDLEDNRTQQNHMEQLLNELDYDYCNDDDDDDGGE